MTTEYTRQAETAQRASAAVHEPGMKINRHIHARAQHLLAADFAQRAGLAKEATAHKKAANDHAKAVKSLSTTMKRFRHGMTDFEAGASDLAALQFASKAKTGDYVRMLNSWTGDSAHGVLMRNRDGKALFRKTLSPEPGMVVPEDLGYPEHTRVELNKKSTATQRKARIKAARKHLDYAALQFASKSIAADYTDDPHELSEDAHWASGYAEAIHDAMADATLVNHIGLTASFKRQLRAAHISAAKRHGIAALAHRKAGNHAKAAHHIEQADLHDSYSERV